MKNVMSMDDNDLNHAFAITLTLNIITERKFQQLTEKERQRCGQRSGTVIISPDNHLHLLRHGIDFIWNPIGSIEQATLAWERSRTWKATRLSKAQAVFRASETHGEGHFEAKIEQTLVRSKVSIQKAIVQAFIIEKYGVSFEF